MSDTRPDGVLEAMTHGQGHERDAELTARLQQRLTELEIKASFTEDTLDRLNDVIVRQQAQIDLLLREVARLSQQPTAADAPAFRSLRDDLPPHY